MMGGRRGCEVWLAVWLATKVGSRRRDEGGALQHGGQSPATTNAGTGRVWWASDDGRGDGEGGRRPRLDGFDGIGCMGTGTIYV